MWLQRNTAVGLSVFFLRLANDASRFLPSSWALRPAAWPPGTSRAWSAGSAVASWTRPAARVGRTPPPWCLPRGRKHSVSRGLGSRGNRQINQSQAGTHSPGGGHTLRRAARCVCGTPVASCWPFQRKPGIKTRQENRSTVVDCWLSLRRWTGRSCARVSPVKCLCDLNPAASAPPWPPGRRSNLRRCPARPSPAACPGRCWFWCLGQGAPPGSDTGHSVLVRHLRFWQWIRERPSVPSRD